MTQNELNLKFAQAYGVRYQRYEPLELRMSPNNIVLRKDKFIPIHTDTLTLLQLCIENGIEVLPSYDEVMCFNTFANVDNTIESYKAHATKEAATRAAMFDALCKFKGIEL